ncbi:MAG: hypothetical protein ACOVLB_03850 [Candidatus Nanopelagicus sp.]|jgi:hypothetical protein
MTRNNKIIEKIGKILTPVELTNLQDIVVFRQNDGTYSLFNKYLINKTKTQSYLVTATKSDINKTFHSLKNAVAWCIFDKRNKFYEANRLLDLDSKLGGLEVAITLHKKLVKNSIDTNTKLIFLAKLSEEKIKQQRITSEIESYTTASNNWQTKRFSLKNKQ